MRLSPLLLPLAALSLGSLSAAPEAGVSLEFLANNDALIGDSLAYVLIENADYKTILSYQRSDYWIDYKPSGNLTIGEKNRRHSSKDSLHLASQGPLADKLIWMAEGGGYLGFDGFQSLWIDEYYRQLFREFPGYQDSDPKGVDGLLGIRWDYLDTSGFMKFSVFAAHDKIAYQWDPVIGEDLRPARTSIDSIGGRLELENVLTTRIRTHNRLTMSDVSGRSPRWSLETMDNFALSDSWVARATLGGALENPDFNAFWTTGAVEWDFERRWFVGINARYYDDNGETAAQVSHGGVNAPPATTFGAHLSVRWIGESNQAAFGVGPYWTRYDRKGSSVDELYSDRTWLWLQLAWSHQF